MSTPESHDAGQAAAAYSLKCTKLEARLAEVARELDEGARFARVRQLESALQECEVERHHAQSALAARDALVVTLREALKSTRDNLWDWVFSRVEGSKRIKVDAASSQCHKADQALALTPSSPAHCAVVSKEELAELRRDKERLDRVLIITGAKEAGLAVERALAQDWSSEIGRAELVKMRAYLDAARQHGEGGAG